MSDLERLIDERARAILAEEKAEVARADAAAAKMARELALLRKYQGRGFPMPRSFLGRGLIAVPVAVVGMVPHFILFPALQITRTEAELKTLGGAKLGAADPYR